MNCCMLLGNLTRDPEVKFLTSGTAVAEFSIACNESWKDANGQKKEKVHYFDCVAFGKRGEAIGKYFTKGKKILIEGKLSQDRWDDKESGKPRSKVRINVQQFHFLPDGKGRDSNQDARQAISGEGDQTQPTWIDPDEGREVPF